MMAEMLADRKSAPANLGHVLVLGYGVTGKACVRYLEPLIGTRVESLTVVGEPDVTVECGGGSGDTQSSNESCARTEVPEGTSGSCGTRFVSTPEAPTFSDRGLYDLCIASPGISEFSDLYKDAASVSKEVISEVEFAWRESAKTSRWVAITGTNGKTTTTALAAHILKGAGLKAEAVGNIGDACIDAVGANLKNPDGGVDSVFVAEVSSYQLASTSQFAPNVAVVLNITPDHLAWHRSHENYADAKWKVLANLFNVPGSIAVLDATNDEVRAKVRELKQIPDADRGFAYVPIGTADGISGDMRARCGAENAAFLGTDGNLHIAISGSEHDLGAAENMQIRGEHNVSNALAASVCAIALGVSDASIRESLTDFAPLEHRLEPAGSINGVACINDSKATNVDSVLKALEAYGGPNTIILLGGHDKGTDLAPLVEACASLKAAVCFGEAGDRFADAFKNASSGTHVLKSQNMESALDSALDVAEQGDTVLLSPACASFDEFSCFEERGEVFKNLVAARG